MRGNSLLHDKKAEEVTAMSQLYMLDIKPEKEFDDIAALAAQLCGASMAAIGFSTTTGISFKAKWGINGQFTEIPEGTALFQNGQKNAGDVILIEDTHKNDPFSTKEFVLNEGIRSIAGAPVQNESGQTLGYLCVFDSKPRMLTQEQVGALRMLANQVATLVKLRLQLLKSEENEYQAIEAQMRTLFLNAVDAVVVTDKTGELLQWNPKAEEIFGWKENEILGRLFYEVCIPSRYHGYHINSLKNTPYFNLYVLKNAIETIGVRKNGMEFDMALGISPAKVKEQTYYIYFMSDITSRKRATKALDKQKEFYENILNNIPTDIAVFDENHKYIFVNPSAIKNDELRKYIIGKDDFEYSEYRKKDKSLAQLRHDKFLEATEQLKEIKWEDSVIGPAGTPITSLRRMFPVHNDKGDLKMVIAYGIDITERKEMEEKQSELLKQLSVQNTQLADFCNIVSHNLRAPLVNMSMLVEFIESCTDPDEQKLLIGKLNPVLDNLSTTFNELVESIQIKQDLEIVSENVALGECLSRTLESLDVEINKLEAVFEINFEETPYINYPSKYMNSIFQNLISNALKYHSPERKPLIKIRTKRENKKVILSVADNGLGIDIERHKDSFFKIGKVFHHHPNAKGFGLFMTKTHIEAMGGKIWLDSAPDKGTTFYIEFINQHI